MEPFIAQANQEAHEQGIRKELDPFLLQRITELTKGIDAVEPRQTMPALQRKSPHCVAENEGI
jgi:hypothetical protein